MFSLSRVLLSALLLAGSLGAAAPIEDATSNADRLARGLAPAAPKRLYDPSRTRHNARQAQNSVGTNDPINAFIQVTPVTPTRKREVEERGAVYRYLYTTGGTYRTTGNYPDTWTFYPSDSKIDDAKVYTVRNNRPARKAKRILTEGWWGARQEDSSKDVSATGKGFLGITLYNSPSSTTGYDAVDLWETNVIKQPALNGPVTLVWYNSVNQPVYPKFYIAAVGEGISQLYAALNPTDIDPAVTSDNEVTLTWVSAVNLNKLG